MEQDITTRFKMFGLCIFNFIVTDPIFAGHKNHCSRRHSGHIDSIVTRGNELLAKFEKANKKG